MQQIVDHYETLVRDIERLNRLLPPVLAETHLGEAQALRERLPEWLQTIVRYHASVGEELKNMLGKTATFIEAARRDYLSLHADYVRICGVLTSLRDAHRAGAPLPWQAVDGFLD